MTISAMGQGLGTAASMLVPPSDAKGVALMSGAACLAGKAVTAFGVAAFGLPSGGLFGAAIVLETARGVAQFAAPIIAGVAYNTYNHFAG